MEIKINKIKGINIAEVETDEIIIHSVQDAIDLMADCNYRDAGNIILKDSNITKDFFDLKTGIAGEILQKFSNYRVRLAITGDFTRYSGRSLRDFIYESNRHGHIFFVSDTQEAYLKLSGGTR
jgi:hypothetical protein